MNNDAHDNLMISILRKALVECAGHTISDLEVAAAEEWLDWLDNDVDLNPEEDDRPYVRDEINRMVPMPDGWFGKDPFTEEKNWQSANPSIGTIINTGFGRPMNLDLTKLREAVDSISRWGAREKSQAETNRERYKHLTAQYGGTRVTVKGDSTEYEFNDDHCLWNYRGVSLVSGKDEYRCRIHNWQISVDVDSGALPDHCGSAVAFRNDQLIEKFDQEAYIGLVNLPDTNLQGEGSFTRPTPEDFGQEPVGYSPQERYRIGQIGDVQMRWQLHDMFKGDLSTAACAYAHTMTGRRKCMVHEKEVTLQFEGHCSKFGEETETLSPAEFETNKQAFRKESEVAFSIARCVWKSEHRSGVAPIYKCITHGLEHHETRPENCSYRQMHMEIDVRKEDLAPCCYWYNKIQAEYICEVHSSGTNNHPREGEHRLCIEAERIAAK